jgi:ribonuclease D
MSLVPLAPFLDGVGLGFLLGMTTERTEMISKSNDEAGIAKNNAAGMTNEGTSPNAQMTKRQSKTSLRHSDFVIPSAFDIGHSSLPSSLIATDSELTELLEKIEPADRVGIDTEADSLHCYREKLCLLQISLPESNVVAGIDNAGSVQRGRDVGEGPRSRLQVGDFIVDPLADIDLAPLCALLERKEIVLHGADFDLRLLRRSLNFVPRRIFDTVIAARLLGIREFSLAALVERFFEIKLAKGSQKANWARRPLPARMAEYALNDTHYLLPLADRLESQLRELNRLDWLRQSCQRALEQAAIARVRDEDELWRISGAGALRGRAAAVLRALWQWREKEAEAVDRPPFHILQNHELLRAAESFAQEKKPDYKHFSTRRRRAFQDAAQTALQLPEAEWPISRRCLGSRPTSETVRRIEELKHQRDRAATKLGLEPSFVASRAALEAIGANEAVAENLLVPWQRDALGL